MEKNPISLEWNAIPLGERCRDIPSPQCNEEPGTYIIFVSTNMYASRELY